MSPGSLDRLGHHVFRGGIELNAGCAAPSPGSFHREEDLRVILQEIMLIFGRKLDHAARLVRVSERGKDLPCNPKVGMVHVRALFGLGQGKREFSKCGRGHQNSPSRFFENNRPGERNVTRPFLIVVLGSPRSERVFHSPSRRLVRDRGW
jgi:hypothetical protein